MFWGKLFLSVKIMAGVIVLFYLARGLTMGQVMLLSAIWSMVSVLVEIPSGYLADRIGRCQTLLLGGFLFLLSWVVMFCADSLPEFILMISLSAAAESCMSGTEEALLYDSLKESGREAEMTRHNGILASGRTAAKVFLPLLGCLIARDLEDWQFRLLIVGDATFALIALTFLYRLKEPSFRSDDSVGRPSIFLRSLHLIRQDPWLVRAIVNKQLAFLAAFLLFRVYQPLLSSLGFSVVAIGLYYAVSRGLMTLVYRRADGLARLFGTGRLLVITAVSGSVLSLAVGLSGSGWFVFVALLLGELSFMTREPLFAQSINGRLESGCRATALSGLNCLGELLSVPIMLLAGWLVGFGDSGLRYLMFLAAGLAMSAVVLLPLQQKDLGRTA
ncbi:MAG: MFS transporter [bacterium]